MTSGRTPDRDAVEPDTDGDVTADDLALGEATGAGPVAVITGASRGIGRHLADGFEDAGWLVERGSRHVAPLSDRAAVTSWVEGILDREGRIDLLVNNAGVIDAEVDVLDSDPDQWWETLEVNLRGAYLMTRLVGPRMRRAGTGRIININSGSAFHGAQVTSAYCASKAALHQLTAATAHAGVPCLDLMPGVVRTDMTRAMAAHRDRTQWTEPSQVLTLALAFATGELDEWSGRMIRAGTDTLASLRAMAARGLGVRERTLVLEHRSADDPLS